ncbi:PhzF family phenazine biosynthesis protein [Streptomyces sp. NPDC058440]|uniref:PhzF family phenazine biosynthesis protein n=1 Tax=Streptomyces sp. NPDC058440 TaxID=3346501 RepID=UPI003664B14E
MRIRVVDAFTDRPFAGNPAAVCLLAVGEWPDEAWMRRVAAEMNHSETAFALPLPTPAEADWAIRWFTPLVESRLCGHAGCCAPTIDRPAGHERRRRPPPSPLRT